MPDDISPALKIIDRISQQIPLLLFAAQRIQTGLPTQALKSLQKQVPAEHSRGTACAAPRRRASPSNDAYSLATALPSRGRCAALDGPRRDAGSRFPGRPPFLDCPSEPPIVAQSLDGGGIRPALRACKVTRQVAGLRHILACGCGNARPGPVGYPPVTPPCSMPKPRHRPSGRSLRDD